MHQVHVPSHHPQPLQTPRRGPVHDPHGVHCWLPVRPPHNDLGFVAVWRYAPLLRSKFFPSFIMELSQLAPPKELRYANIYIYIYQFAQMSFDALNIVDQVIGKSGS